MTPGPAEEHSPPHLVTGTPHRAAAHAARPAVSRRALLIALSAAVRAGGVVTVVVGRTDSVPSAPASAERITVSPRVTSVTGGAAGVGQR